VDNLAGLRYLGTIEQLDACKRQNVKETNLKYIEQSGINRIEANVIYAVAVK
jgi:hypothetical protein